MPDDLRMSRRYMDPKGSFSRILASSSLMGGVAGLNLLLGMLRVKFAAVLIGSSGVGLIAGLTAVQGFTSTLFGLGIPSSGIRQIANETTNDTEALARTVHTLRRLCWVTGLAAVAILCAFGSPISEFAFGDRSRSREIAAVGLIVLFGSLSGGQMALIQGMRRIRDLAASTMIGATAGTIATIGCYATWGEGGIVPALVAAAACQLGVSWWFASRLPVPEGSLTWRDSLREGGKLLQLGLALMWANILATAVSFGIVALVTKAVGLSAAGIYSAAFALSGMLINFILNAMSSEYYPRLSQLASDTPAMNQLVNEQTEAGCLLGIPGLLATMAFAPWAVHIFYTSEFLPAVQLVDWFVLGCFLKLLSWPMGFIILARNERRLFIAVETASNLLHIVFAVAGVLLFGVVGVAMAFSALYIAYLIATLVIGWRLSRFAWSQRTRKLVATSAVLLISCFFSVTLLPAFTRLPVAVAITATSCLLSLRGLMDRLGPEHRIVKAAVQRMPALARWMAVEHNSAPKT